jgi:hypothetical protein
MLLFLYGLSERLETLYHTSLPFVYVHIVEMKGSIVMVDLRGEEDVHKNCECFSL